MDHHESKRLRIYLAGPDLFFPNAEERYKRLKRACDVEGLIGVSPSDGLEPGLLSGLAEADRIYRHDLRLLSSCDAVLVNLRPFRGIEPDSGSVFEAAYAFAQGVPVAGYTVDGLNTLQRHQVMRAVLCDGAGFIRDKIDGGLVENFDQPVNLMLSCSFPVVKTPEVALEHLSHALRQRKPTGLN